MTARDFSHFSGCLLGGAIGDALGAPVEFYSLNDIRRLYGPEGVRDFAAVDAHGRAEVTDDTQMTLFTAEGLLVARQAGAPEPVEAIYRGYLRWLRTQRTRLSTSTGELAREGWLMGVQAMWKVRAPGGTCLSALASGHMGTLDTPINNSKGCGGVMRVAPVGLVYPGSLAFERACQAAAITHGHSCGYLSAGVFAQILAEIIALMEGPDVPTPREILLTAVQASLRTLAHWPDHEETLAAVERALDAADTMPPTPESVERLGGGWVGEEALAIALFCALAHSEDFASAVLLSVNHSGDSDSTGSLTGNLLGLLLGVEAIPQYWLRRIELREEIERIARELLN